MAISCDTRRLGRIFICAVEGWFEDRASSMGAAIAYYTAFSMAPLLLLVIAVAGMAFGDHAARSAVMEQIAALVGTRGAEAVQTVLAGAQGKNGGIVSATLGIIMVLVGATTVFGELQRDLDRIWKIDTPGSGLLKTLRIRLLSFGLVLGMGFLLMVSLIVSAAIAMLGHHLGESFPGQEVLLQTINAAFSLLVTSLLFATIYKLLPSTTVLWRDVWVGGTFTAALFTVGKLLIGIYIGRTALASSFGAAGAFLVLLVWIYYSAQIFLFGAEVTYHYARLSRGSLKSRPPG